MVKPMMCKHGAPSYCSTPNFGLGLTVDSRSAINIDVHQMSAARKRDRNMRIFLAAFRPPVSEDISGTKAEHECHNCGCFGHGRDCGGYLLRVLPLMVGHCPQSSSASRVTAGACGFLLLIQSGERPERYRESLRFDTIPSSPSLQA